MMLAQYNYKTKLIALGIGTLAFTWIAYKLAFSKTVALYSKQNQLVRDLEQTNSIQLEIAALQKQLNKTGGANQQFSEEWIFEVVTELCEKLDIVIAGLHQGERFQHEQNEVITHQIVLKGTYKNILKAMFAMEQDFKIGAIVSARFYKQKNRVTKEEELYCHFYLRNITPINK